jgi:hypothetical protein
MRTNEKGDTLSPVEFQISVDSKNPTKGFSVKVLSTAFDSRDGQEYNPMIPVETLDLSGVPDDELNVIVRFFADRYNELQKEVEDGTD